MLVCSLVPLICCACFRLLQVGSIQERHWRAFFAQLPMFSYSCTVFHLINAIRKIAQIAALQHALDEPRQSNEDTQEVMLYRGVRGKLPDLF